MASWRWWKAVVQVSYHVFFIASILWMNLHPSRGVQGAAKTRAVLTAILAPAVLYQTVKSWWRGTYFPLTQSDSFHILRFGTKADRDPPWIGCDVVVCMVWMGLFYSALMIVSFAAACKDACFGEPSWGPCHARYDALTDMQRTNIQAHLIFYIVYAICRLKTLVLTCVFTVSLLIAAGGLSAVTCGYGCCVLCAFCVHGFNRESRFLCIPCSVLYEYVAFFYRWM